MPGPSDSKPEERSLGMRALAGAARQRRGVAAAIALGAALLSTSCFTGNQGLSPPHDSFYFPTGMVVSPGRTALYVANSDFDLEYNGGTVQAIDLVSFRKQLAGMLDALQKGDVGTACAATGVNQNDILSPGPCDAIAVSPFVKSFATIGAFASNALLVPRPDAPGMRLFIPVRGDPSVTYFDVDDDRDGGAQTFRLDCGGTGADERCAPFNKIGENPYDNLRRLTLPVEPVGIAAADDSLSIVVANQEDAAASLIVNAWDPPQRPTLQFYIQSLAAGPTELATIPEPQLFKSITTPTAYQPGFLLTFNSAATVDILRYQNDSDAVPPRPFLTLDASFSTSITGSGSDSRGIAIDATNRQACEKGCASGDGACLAACASGTPLDVYVANRQPPSLLVGQIFTNIIYSNGVPVGGYDSGRLIKAYPLTFGATKVAIGNVIDRDGKLSPRVFTVCFDARFVFSFDPKEKRIDAIIRTGRGPQTIAFDTGDDGDGLHSYLYVGHFTDSYIGVVDLDMRHPETFGNMFASLGVPTPPSESLAETSP